MGETRSEITRAYQAVNVVYDAFMSFIPSGDDKKDQQEIGRILAVLWVKTAVLQIPIEYGCRRLIPELEGDALQDPGKRFCTLLYHSIHSK